MRRKNINYQSTQNLSGQLPPPSGNYLPENNVTANSSSSIKKDVRKQCQQVCSCHQQNNYPQKVGIYRMDDYITGQYDKQRLYNYKKGLNNEKNFSSRLPYISSVNEFDDQSKLMSQIRRAQNRIQLMRHDRSQFNNSNNQYEMIRPFIELQNHNMLNMQMMMMAQQNKQQCCGHPNMQCMGYGHPNVQCMGYGQPNAQCMGCGQPNYGCVHGGQLNNCKTVVEQSEIKSLKERIERIQKEKKKERDKKQEKDAWNFKTNHKSNKSLVKATKNHKFRVAVIAVMFSLLFPKFANKFTDKRFKLHSDRYFNQKQSHSQRISLLFFKEISAINCYKVAKTVEQYRKQKTNQRASKMKTAKLIISEQYREQKNYEIYVGDIELFLLQFLKQFQLLVKQGGLDETINSLGQINQPFSFPCDLVYLLEELYKVNCHPKKLYMCISPQHSKALILSQIFVKVLIFNYLFIIRQDAQWKKNLMKQNNLTNDQKIDGQMTATQMYISGVLLHRNCMEIIRNMISSSAGNLSQINPNNIPIPLQTMTYDNVKDPVGSQSGSNRKFPQSSHKSFDRGSQIKVASSNSLQLQKNETIYLNNFEYIKNLKQFNTLVDEIQKKSGHKAQVQNKIMTILNVIQQKLKNNRKRQYKLIKEDLLKNEKHILINKSKENITYEMPKRTTKEKSYIQDVLKIIKESKVKQINGETPNQSYQRISGNHIFQMQRDNMAIQERSQGQQSSRL